MKLTPAQIEQTTMQFDAQPVPEESRLAPELFGDHTFFLGTDGLHIVEAAEGGAREARVVKLAGWTDPDRTALTRSMHRS